MSVKIGSKNSNIFCVLSHVDTMVDSLPAALPLPGGTEDELEPISGNWTTTLTGRVADAVGL
ncbi:MAG: hypothetical protein ACFCU4_02360 [Puniceicoccaceae bacterium]